MDEWPAPDLEVYTVCGRLWQFSHPSGRYSPNQGLYTRPLFGSTYNVTHFLWDTLGLWVESVTKERLRLS